MTSTKMLEQWDKEYVWHPFTQMRDWRRSEVTIIDRAQGSYLIDTKGKRYLDGVSSLWCNIHGHRVPEVDKALIHQTRKVAHSTFLGLSNVPAIQLSKKLVEITPPGLRKVFYSDSGSEAVEIALKMAFQYWKHKGKPGKTRFLKFQNAYHGDTVGSVSVGGIGLFHEIFKPLLFKTLMAPAPYRYRDSFRGTESDYARHSADKVERILKKHSPGIAAIVMEPMIQGAAGMITQPKGFLKRIEQLARKYKCLLILDEVATGFGRTGKMFALEHESVSPDILCLAKGLTAGYLPLAATLATQEIYEAFLGEYEDFKTFFHGHTYTANPLACRAALANLQIFERKKVLERNQKLIQQLSRELKRFYELESVGDIRQKGLMVGIELVKNRRTKKPWNLKDQIGHNVTLEAKRHNVIIRPLGNVIILMPPYSFTSRELSRLCDITYSSIRTVSNTFLPPSARRRPARSSAARSAFRRSEAEMFEHGPAPGTRGKGGVIHRTTA